MKKTKLLLAIMSVSAAFVANAVTHQHIEGQSCPLHGDAFMTVEGVAAKKAAQKRLLSQRSTQSVAATATMDNPAIIDVAVLMHSTWIDAMSEQLSQDQNGKFYENGAQFAIERVKAQYAYYNESLKLQNVPAVLRPVYFAETNNQITSGNSLADQQAEYATVYNCVMNPKWVEINNGNQELCESQGLFRINDIASSSVDVMHYIREVKEGQSTGGLGGYYQGIAIFDAYRSGWRIVKASNDAGENFYTADDVNSMRFGHVNASTLTHELGHVFGGMHNVWDGEPADGKDNRAYSCGKKDPRSQPLPGEKKPTALWSNGGWLTNENHRFYSNPDVTVDGDVCGVVGEANNLRVVKENAPLVALNKTLAADASDLQFVIDSYSVTRAEGTVSITIKRTGDINQAAYLSLTAKDGSAWEGRDFDFGFKEIAFAAGESEKTVVVNLLPRSERHADTEFSLQIHGAVGASFPEQGPSIRIVSENPLQAGTVQFELGSVTVTEGAKATVNVSRLNGQDGDIQYALTATDGTAKAGTDYTFTSRTQTMKSGEVQVSFEIPTQLLAGKQGSRNLSLTLSAVTGGAILGSMDTTTVNIVDASEPGKLAFSTAATTVTEGGSLTLTINRTEGTDGEVTVNVRSLAGTATAGLDFTAFSQSVTIPSGQNSASVTVNTLNRSGSQGARYFDVVLANPTAGTISADTPSVRVTINDQTVEPPAGQESGSGGSMGWMMMLALALIGAMRRTAK